MYLIHLRLRSADRRTALPPQAGDWLWAAAGASDRVEHVAVHALAHPDPVLAMYVLADNLAEAEARAGAVCRRALATRPELTGWELLRGEAPLVMPFFEGLPAATGEPGRNGPGPFPST
jgi:hypothetical protein